MEKHEKEFDAVRLMREIREQLTHDLAGKSFEEQQRYIRERVQLPEPSSRSSAA